MFQVIPEPLHLIVLRNIEFCKISELGPSARNILMETHPCCAVKHLTVFAVWMLYCSKIRLE